MPILGYKLYYHFMTLKLASGSYDNTIRFWDPSTSSSNPKETIKLSSTPNRIEITEDKTKIVVGMNNCVKVYDLSKPEQPTRSFDNDFKGNVTAVGCFWKQEKYIYTACEDGYLRVFDIRSKNMAKSIKHNKPISCAALHPN
jgi:WD40 repeat protein